MRAELNSGCPFNKTHPTGELVRGPSIGLAARGDKRNHGTKCVEAMSHGENNSERKGTGKPMAVRGSLHPLLIGIP
eukprot:15738333-Heterocapsa_arctica.AAC.1